MDIVIEYYDKNPCLPVAEANEIVKNITTLYRSAEDILVSTILLFILLFIIEFNTPQILGYPQISARVFWAQLTTLLYTTHLPSVRA